MSDGFPLSLELTGDDAIPQGASYAYGFCLEADSLPAPPFVASTRYDLYDFVTPISNPNGLVFMTTSSGTSDASEPLWSTAKIGQRYVSNAASFTRVRSSRPIDTSAWDAEMTIRAAAAASEPPSAGEEVSHNTVGNGRLERGFDPPKWQASHVYAEGERVVPLVLNGYVYQCINGGTSGASSPLFYNAIDLGAVLTDSGVTWRCVMADEGVVTNLRIALDSTYTGTLDEWGSGSFTLDIVDEFGERTRFARGPAVLEPTDNY